MRRIFDDVGDRNLVRPPIAFQLVTVQLFGGGPAFGRTEDDHGPALVVHSIAASASILLDGADLIDAGLEQLPPFDGA